MNKRKGLRGTAWVLLAIILVLSMALSGCSSNNEEEGSSQPTMTATTKPDDMVKDEPKEPISITWHGNFQNEISKDSTIELMLEKKFNVTIDYMNAMNDKLTLMLASGDLPDVIKLPDPKDVADFAKSGELLELPLDMLKEKVPSIYEAINQVDESLWGLTKVDGKNFAIPQYSYPPGASLLRWRQDILTLAGIDKAPSTIAEYDAAFKAIKDNEKKIIEATNPALKKIYMFNQNDVSYPWSAFSWLFGAYGSMPGSWQLDDSGKVVRGEILPGTKGALEKMREWYAAGYIDPAFVTDTGDQYWSKWVIGEYVVGVNTGVGEAAVQNDPPGGRNAEILKNVPGLQWTYVKPPQGPEGKLGAWSWGKRQNFVALSAKLADQPEKLDKVLEMLEAIASDDKLWLEASYGIEGTTYELTNGIPKMKDPYNKVKNIEAQQLGAFGKNGSPFAPFGSIETLNKYIDPRVVDTFKSLGEGTEKPDVIYMLPLESSLEMEKRVSEKWTATMIDIILGNKPVSEYDEFVKWFNSNGGQKWTDEANQLYNDQFKK